MTRIHPALIALVLIALLGCLPGSGAIVLEARSGRVVEDPTGRAVASADVFQVYLGRGAAGEPRPAYSLRWTQTSESGEFVFREALADEPRAWVLKTDAPEYGFVHPDFGLVRAGVAGANGNLVLTGKRLDEAGRRASEMSVCGSRPADDVLAGAADRYCPRLR